jgi:hypothetical protein
MEKKAIPLEVKDLDTSKRTAIIAHAHYDNLDRVKDVSRKGMFTKSWSESKSDIALYLNHDDNLAPGRVEDVYDEGSKAMTKAWFGTHTLGNDTLLMLDEKVIKWASFGYIPIKTKSIQVKETQARELLEVKHIETSPLTKMPANPLAGVVSVTKAAIPELKSMSQNEFSVLKQIAMMDNETLRLMMQLSGEIDSSSDLYNWILWQISRRADMMSSIRSQLQYNAPEIKSLSEHITHMETFCANTKASDECIKSVLENIEEAKTIISSYDTADTSLITKPAASSEDKSGALLKQLLLFKTQLGATA